LPRSALAVVGFAALAGGCFASDTGYDPPTDAFYFPTGLIVSPDRKTLYAINSDFDLQYNGGTVLRLRLEEKDQLRDRLSALVTALNPPSEAAGSAVSEACKAFGSAPQKANKTSFLNENALLNPGPCNPAPLKPLVEKSAVIGAFASGAVLVSRPDNPATLEVESEERLFVPVRGDPSLTFFDVTAGRLHCDRTGDRCNANNKVGVAPFDNSRQLTLPVEPVGIAAAEDGEAIVVAHQTENAVSLSVNRWRDQSKGRPTLEYVARNLAEEPSEVVAVPVPGLAAASQLPPIDQVPPRLSYEPGFLVTYRAAPQIDLFRYTADGGTLPRPFLSRVASTAINIIADGKDARGIAIDASERQACEAPCSATNDACVTACATLTGGSPEETAKLRNDCAAFCRKENVGCMQKAACTDIPLRLFVANRAPASLLVGKIETTLAKENENVTGAFDVVSIQETVPLAFGASKVVVGKVLDLEGTPRVRVFVAAFDSRLVFSYDPEAHRIDAVFRTGRGPHALAVDTRPASAEDSGHAFLYVGHFTDSYLGVVDLDMRHPNTFGTMFASVGTPIPPRESK
jgi:hypothetical protein